ncbi:MAG: hypothetical protein E6Q36_02270 [Chryseobacterium sp.]|nr:MAG: hypothetical protein E6Q36_02270 [Chryseobacterium sp.]
MSKEQTEIILTLLCASQVLHEALDELQGTKFYRHSLKHAAKRLEEELTKVCDPIIKSVHPQDEEIFNLIMEGINQVGKQLATLDPAVIARVALIIHEQNTITHDTSRENQETGDNYPEGGQEG